MLEESRSSQCYRDHRACTKAQGACEDPAQPEVPYQIVSGSRSHQFKSRENKVRDNAKPQLGDTQISTLLKGIAEHVSKSLFDGVPEFRHKTGRIQPQQPSITTDRPH